ncbi:hypothetical protein [Streptomyces sp. NPDC053367]|uniref:hypothetical protein n=1 Tax=Streptomyces sp. NPDC053367 TaxID=3365700 RepID=UPI0037D7A27D
MPARLHDRRAVRRLVLRRERAQLVEVPRPGPATVRAGRRPGPLLDPRTEADTEVPPVTDPEGRFLGLVARDRRAQALEKR